MFDCYTDNPAEAIDIISVTAADCPAWLAELPGKLQRWLQANQFAAKAGESCLLPNSDGTLGAVVVGLGDAPDLFALADLPKRLPAGTYTLNPEHPAFTDWALGWGLGAYRFPGYHKPDETHSVQLFLPAGASGERLQAELRALSRVRDLINTPANDMLPPQLAAAIQAVGAEQDAQVTEIQGADLLAQGYPLVHAVGRASTEAPRLLDLRWGKAGAPKITLVGKGVCFDSGGLDLKPASGMRIMKKDMGGAAHALGLAELIMAADLPVQLRLLVPAVENAVAGNAFRPGDILPSRQGLHIEIENTDAEGRLVLADALTAASEDRPDVLIDFATLTGAARVALGTELPAFFTTNDSWAEKLHTLAAERTDPIWRLPLHDGYRQELDSQVADLMNASEGRFGGAITAALFLREFVGADLDWLHFDLMAWNQRARPGRPKGGEAMGLRTVFAWLQQRYGQ